MDERIAARTAGSADDVLLRTEHLVKMFGTRKAVDDVSLEIRRGEVFGLVGESGCGKTTIARCLIGLYAPSSGSIIYRGRSVGGYERREGMQMIFQDPAASLDPRMTASDIIAEGLIIRGERDREEISRKVLRMMELVGLEPRHGDRYPHEFSGGQRQRIGIARAVIMQPDLLIADEPVSALDVSVRAQIIDLLRELQGRFGMAMLFIAHDLTAVRHFSGRIGVMYRGRLVEAAPSEELFREPLHPYTRSLLSAVPLPDPRAEKQRKRISWDPSVLQDGADKTLSFREIRPQHFVLCNKEDYPDLTF